MSRGNSARAFWRAASGVPFGKNQRAAWRPPCNYLQVPVSNELLLLRSFLLVAKASLHTASDRGQHLLGGVGVGSGRLQFQILLEGFRSARRRDHLVSLERGFANHVHALPVVSVGAVGIGGNNFVEGGERVIDLAGVGQNCTGVEVILGGAARIGLRCVLISFHRFIG